VAAEGTFLELMQRVRAGDETAALELHATYADQLQRIIRIRLTQSALRRQMDSIDICQSVFADFFVRTALGQYDLKSPTELLKLLATMGRNRLIHHAQKQRAARRDIRRVEGGAVEDFALPGGEGTPSQIVSARELLQQCQARLTADERALLEQRRAGQGWDEIAATSGKSKHRRRKRATGMPVSPGSSDGSMKHLATSSWPRSRFSSTSNASKPKGKTRDLAMNDFPTGLRRRMRFPLCLVVTLLPNSSLIADEKADEPLVIREIQRLGGKVCRSDNLPGRPITAIDFDGSQRVGDKDLFLLRRFKDLTALGLRFTRVTDVGLKEVREHKNLTVLNLSAPKITDTGLKELRELKKLKELYLRGTRTTDTGLKELKELNNLTTLVLSSTRITNAGLKELSELPNLTTLDLSLTRITDAGMKQIGTLKNLTWLNLIGTKITGASLKELGGLESLTTLNLRHTQIADRDLKHLRTLKSLRTLGLRGTRITDAGLKEIESLRGLTALYLGETVLTDAGLKDLQELKNLRELNLGATRVTDAGLKELRELKNLTLLNLTKTRITDAGLKEIKELKNLMELYLGETEVTDAGLKELQELKNLTTLDLSKTRVTEAGLKEIRGSLPKLTR
jgi:internalin A